MAVNSSDVTIAAVDPAFGRVQSTADPTAVSNTGSAPLIPSEYRE